MAMAAAQQNQLVSDANRLFDAKYDGGHVFTDKATENGNYMLEKVLNEARQKTCGGATIASNIQGTDPGSPGNVGNAIVQQQYAERCMYARAYLISTVFPGSDLYRLFMNEPAYVNPAGGVSAATVIWTHLNGPDVVYMAPDDSVAQAHIRTVKKWTQEDLPADQRNKQWVLNWKVKLTTHNPMNHPNHVIPEPELISVFADGLHPEMQVYAKKIINNPAANPQFLHPAVYPAHDARSNLAPPNNAPANAGTMSLDLLANECHKHFQILISATKITIPKINDKPAVNALEGDPVPSAEETGQQQHEEARPDDSAVGGTQNERNIFMSWRDAEDNGYDDLSNYAFAFLGRNVGTFRTCWNCGGVNHMAKDKDGKFVCPTPEGSVSPAMLSMIQYPVDVNPWQYYGGRGGSGKGSYRGGRGGKGRGKGKGKGGYGRGGKGGRGVNLTDNGGGFHVSTDYDYFDEY